VNEWMVMDEWMVMNEWMVMVTVISMNTVTEGCVQWCSSVNHHEWSRASLDHPLSSGWNDNRYLVQDIILAVPSKEASETCNKIFRIKIQLLCPLSC